jgi:hypothetical protein
VKHRNTAVACALLVAASVAVAQQSVVPLTRPGEFRSPMTLTQFANAKSDGMYRVEVLSSLAIHGAAEGVCTYLQDVRIVDVVRGPEFREAALCADLPLTAGKQYVVSVYGLKHVETTLATDVEHAVLRAQVKASTIFLVKPFWFYSVYTVKGKGGTSKDFVIIPTAHLDGAQSCLARTETRINRVSDDPLEDETSFNHFELSCLLHAMAEVSPGPK